MINKCYLYVLTFHRKIEVTKMVIRSSKSRDDRLQWPKKNKKTNSCHKTLHRKLTLHSTNKALHRNLTLHSTNKALHRKPTLHSTNLTKTGCKLTYFDYEQLLLPLVAASCYLCLQSRDKSGKTKGKNCDFDYRRTYFWPTDTDDGDIKSFKVMTAT